MASSAGKRCFSPSFAPPYLEERRQKVKKIESSELNPAPKAATKNKLYEFKTAKQECYEGDFASGIPKLIELSNRYSKDESIRAYLAYFLLQSGRYEDAIEAAEKSIKIKTNVLAHQTTFNAWLKLGNINECKSKLGRIKKLRSAKIKQLCKILDMENLLEGLLLIRFDVKDLFLKNNYPLVIQKCEVGLRTSPLDLPLLTYKMGALFKQERYSSAVQMLTVPTNKVIKSETNCCKWLALSYYILMEMPKAVEVLQGNVEPTIVDLRSSLEKIQEAWTEANASGDLNAVVASSLLALEEMKRIEISNLNLETKLMTLALAAYEKLGRRTEALNMLSEATEKGIKIPLSASFQSMLNLAPLIKAHKWTLAKNMINSILKSEGSSGNATSNEPIWMEKLRIVRILESSQSWETGNLNARVKVAVDLLEVQNSKDLCKVSLADIKKAFTKCLLKYHPDKNIDGDQDLRHLYDELTKLQVQAKKYLTDNFESYLAARKAELERKPEQAKGGSVAPTMGWVNAQTVNVEDPLDFWKWIEKGRAKRLDRKMKKKEKERQEAAAEKLRQKQEKKAYKDYLNSRM